MPKQIVSLSRYVGSGGTWHTVWEISFNKTNQLKIHKFFNFIYEFKIHKNYLTMRSFISSEILQWSVFSWTYFEKSCTVFWFYPHPMVAMFVAIVARSINMEGPRTPAVGKGQVLADAEKNSAWQQGRVGLPVVVKRINPKPPPGSYWRMVIAEPFHSLERNLQK